MLKNIQERVPAVGIVCIGGEGAGIEQRCGGRNDLGCAGDGMKTFLPYGEVQWGGQLNSGQEEFRCCLLGPWGFSASLHKNSLRVLGFPHLLVLSPLSLYLLTRHQEVHGQGTRRAAR